MCIPNNEEWINWLQLSNAPPLDVVVAALLGGDLKKFHHLLFQTVLQDISFHDVGGSNAGMKSELFYHGYLMGWLGHAKFTGCDIKSNREAVTML